MASLSAHKGLFSGQPEGCHLHKRTVEEILKQPSQKARIRIT